jgi:hypothetical protein
VVVRWSRSITEFTLSSFVEGSEMTNYLRIISSAQGEKVFLAYGAVLLVQYFFHLLNDLRRLVHNALRQCLQLLAGRRL